MSFHEVTNEIYCLDQAITQKNYEFHFVNHSYIKETQLKDSLNKKNSDLIYYVSMQCEVIDVDE